MIKSQTTSKIIIRGADKQLLHCTVKKTEQDKIICKEKQSLFDSHYIYFISILISIQSQKSSFLSLSCELAVSIYNVW